MTSPPTIDLNADLGEDPAQLARDLELLTIVTSANIACGGHAGDTATIDALLARCIDLGIAAGAHPSYPDPANFGRVEMPITPDALEHSLIDQLRLIADLADRRSIPISHIKPHGALYHAASRPDVAATIARAVEAVYGRVPSLVGAANSPALDHWAAAGFRTLDEGFADRRYERDGTLRPRSRDGSVIHDLRLAEVQAVLIATHGIVVTEDDDKISVPARTLCIHSDTPDAVAVAEAVRHALERSGVTIRQPDR